MHLPRFVPLVLSLMFAVTLTACGGGGGQQTASGPDQQQAQQQANVDPSQFGTITVTVNYEGSAPQGEEIYTGSNPECQVENVVKKSIHVNDDNTLQYAVVSVQEGPAGFASSSDGQVVIDQANCQYEPHVITAQAGQTVLVKNSDPGLHNVRATLEGSQIFNKSTLQDQSFETNFDSAGVYSLVCDVHNWMQGWVYVTSHGKASVTGEDGSATLSELPPGDYTLTIWQEELGTQTKTVSLDPQQEASLSVTVGK